MAEDVTMVERVGQAVLDELSSRAGFDGILDNLDDDLRSEVREAVARAALNAVDPPGLFDYLRALAATPQGRG